MHWIAIPKVDGSNHKLNLWIYAQKNMIFHSSAQKVKVDGDMVEKIATKKYISCSVFGLDVGLLCMG